MRLTKYYFQFPKNPLSTICPESPLAFCHILPIFTLWKNTFLIFKKAMPQALHFDVA